jgi:hypothetical protein
MANWVSSGMKPLDAWASPGGQDGALAPPWNNVISTAIGKIPKDK